MFIAEFVGGFAGAVDGADEADFDVVGHSESVFVHVVSSVGVERPAYLCKSVVVGMDDGGVVGVQGFRRGDGIFRQVLQGSQSMSSVPIVCSTSCAFINSNAVLLLASMRKRGFQYPSIT